MKILAHLALTGGLLSTLSCALSPDALAKRLIKTMPVADVATQRSQAIVSATNALSEITEPNLAFGVSVPTLERLLNSAPLKALGVQSVKLSGEQQLLRADVAFSRKFSGGKLLDKLQPEVSGTLSFYAGITSGTTEGENESVLTLTLLPALTGVTIDSAVVRDRYNLTALGKELAGVLTQYAANISGELARSPAMRINIPTTLADVKHPIKLPVAGGLADITLTDQPIRAPVRLFGVAWLITDDSITGLAQTVPVEGVSLAAGAQEPPPYEALRQQFLETFNRAFAPPSLSKDAWVAIRKDLLAFITNNVVQQAEVCITSDAELPRQALSKEVRFPEAPAGDCTSTHVCPEAAPCNFTPQRDTRDCTRCVRFRPGPPFGDGGCAEQGNDPLCELARAAKNKLFDAAAALKKSDCERLNFTAKVACDAQKTSEKALCEAKKDVLTRLAKTGTLASVEAGVSARTENLRVCLQRLRISPQVDQAEIALQVTGAASADVDVKFVPLDLAGKLVCQVPFAGSQHFRASLRETHLSFAPRFVLLGNQAKITLPAGNVPLRLEPGPTQFLVDNVDLRLSCRGLNLIKPLVLLLTPFIPALRGDIDFKYPERELLVDLPMPRQRVLDVPVAASLGQSPTAFFLSGEIEP